MEIIESINMLSWPAATAILGSVVTAVVGLFGYLRSVKTSQPDPEIQALHNRVSALKDSILAVEGDVKALSAHLDGVARLSAEQDARDIQDFQALNVKVEKIMEIIVEMLRTSNSS